MWDLSSLARAGGRAPRLGSAGSKPLDAREAPALNSGQTLSADFSCQSAAAKTRLLNKKSKSLQSACKAKDANSEARHQAS